jgi:PAN domain
MRIELWLTMLALTLAVAAAPHAQAADDPFEARPKSYVAGEGYKSTRGVRFAECERECASDPQCRMYEFYRPTRTCNLFLHTRVAGPSDDSEVGIKTAAAVAAPPPAAGTATAALPAVEPTPNTAEPAPRARPLRRWQLAGRQPSPPPPREGETTACPALYPRGTLPFAGLFPAIEGRIGLSNFKPSQIVEIDVTTMSEAAARGYIRALQRRSILVSVYLPGGHCYRRRGDCAALESAGVTSVSTGSWNWDADESRIVEIDHPASIERLVRGAEQGWRLGANYVRIDNLHNPAGSKHPRDARQLAQIYAAIHALEDDLRTTGTIPADRPTGVVAHNSLDVWEQMIRAQMLARPPVFLTSERTAQLAFKGQGYRGDAKLKAGQLRPTDVEEIMAGSRIATALGIPYTVAEFAISHDLGGQAGQTYVLPRRYVEQLAAMPGVSEVLVIPNEATYVGPGEAVPGLGPRTLNAGPLPADAGATARACLGQ